MEVVLRSKTGSKSAQWARKNGFVPGIIYGGPGGPGSSGAPAGVVLTYSKEEDLRREIAARRISFLNTLYEM